MYNIHALPKIAVGALLKNEKISDVRDSATSQPLQWSRY